MSEMCQKLFLVIGVNAFKSCSDWCWAEACWGRQWEKKKPSLNGNRIYAAMLLAGVVMPHILERYKSPRGELHARNNNDEFCSDVVFYVFFFLACRLTLVFSILRKCTCAI
jgi:hypothetical protein